MTRYNSALKVRTGWSLGLGLLLVVLGVLAISAPFIAALALALVTGWLLLSAGMEQVVFAVHHFAQHGLITKLLLGGIYLVAGGVLLRRPLTGVLTITTIVAVLVILDEILEIGLGIRLRETVGTRWLVTGGILSLVLGGLTLRTLPTRPGWMIGTLIGIRLVFKGIEHIRLHPYNPDFEEHGTWPRRAA